MKKKMMTALCIALLLAGMRMDVARGQSVWTESSFADFVDGSFTDAGSNAYVSAGGRMQMISRWDFNGDGYLDVLLPPGHGQTEKENTSIYLNNGADIDARSRIELPGCGSRDGLIADFNRDGWNDLAVANYRDSHVGWVDAWVFYGGPDGLSAQRRDELPAYSGQSLAAGDFNNDGWLDLAIACQWQEGEEENPIGLRTSFIYWNSGGHFQPERRLALTFDGNGAESAAAGDLDRDGQSDLVMLASGATHVFYSGQDAFAHPERRVTLPFKGRSVALGDVNGDHQLDLAICGEGGVLIVPAGAAGYAAASTVLLPVYSPRRAALVDVDGDGLDDVAVANYSSAGGATWCDSYLFYSDGGDFTGRKPLALPTLGATGVCSGDLNGDGRPELVFSNERITTEAALLSYVYWNQEGRFYFGNHTQLPTQGASSAAIGDLNGDHRPDVAFFNTEGGLRDGYATGYLYWGNGTRTFSREHSREFLMMPMFGTASADLDDDGRVDLMLARAHGIDGVSHNQSGLSLYWGGEDGPERTSHLTMATGYGGARIADINRDGWLDIVAGGHCIDLEDNTKSGFPVFWGSAEGFQQHRRTVLHIPGYRLRAPLLMDLNRDGWLDLAGQVVDGKIKFWWGGTDGFRNDRCSEMELAHKYHLMYIQGADFDRDGWLDLLLPHRGPPNGDESTSLIYYGSSQGYSNQRYVEIPCYVTYQNSIADFDRDGWLDIFLCSYGGEVKGNRPSLVYYGGPEGFLKRPRTELATFGASGSQAADFDNDGWLDLLVTNHRSSGSYLQPEPHRHICPSMLFWGGPKGFASERRWQATAVGPSGLNVRDPGNSYDRGLYEDYVSSAHEMPQGQIPVSISWEAETPHRTSVKFQVRIAETKDQLASALWHGPGGEDTWYTRSGAKIKKLTGQWIQYRARLVTPNGAATPCLTSVSVAFH